MKETIIYRIKKNKDNIIINPNPYLVNLIIKNVVIFDQTMGCRLCWEAWWGDNSTDIFADFHENNCILKGKSEEHIAANIVDRKYAYNMNADD